MGSGDHRRGRAAGRDGGAAGGTAGFALASIRHRLGGVIATGARWCCAGGCEVYGPRRRARRAWRCSRSRPACSARWRRRPLLAPAGGDDVGRQLRPARRDLRADALPARSDAAVGAARRRWRSCAARSAASCTGRAAAVLARRRRPVGRCSSPCALPPPSAASRARGSSRSSRSRRARLDGRARACPPRARRPSICRRPRSTHSTGSAGRPDASTRAAAAGVDGGHVAATRASGAVAGARSRRNARAAGPDVVVGGACRWPRCARRGAAVATPASLHRCRLGGDAALPRRAALAGDGANRAACSWRRSLALLAGGMLGPVAAGAGRACGDRRGARAGGGGAAAVADDPGGVRCDAWLPLPASRRQEAGRRDRPERLLIVLLGAIGDVVCGMPLVQRLRAGWPATRIAWAVEPAAAPLLQSASGGRRGHRLSPRRRAVPALIEFLRAVRASRPDADARPAAPLQERADQLVVGGAAPGRVPLAQLARGQPALQHRDRSQPVRDFTPKLTPLPALRRLLSACRRRRYRSASPRPRRSASASRRCSPRPASVSPRSTSARPGRAAAGCRAPTAALCGALRARGLGVVLVGGPGDAPFAEPVRRRPAPATW